MNKDPWDSIEGATQCDMEAEMQARTTSFAHWETDDLHAEQSGQAINALNIILRSSHLKDILAFLTDDELKEFLSMRRVIDDIDQELHNRSARK